MRAPQSRRRPAPPMPRGRETSERREEKRRLSQKFAARRPAALPGRPARRRLPAGRPDPGGPECRPARPGHALRDRRRMRRERPKPASTPRRPDETRSKDNCGPVALARQFASWQHELPSFAAPGDIEFPERCACFRKPGATSARRPCRSRRRHRGRTERISPSLSAFPARHHSLRFAAKAPAMLPRWNRPPTSSPFGP